MSEPTELDSYSSATLAAAVDMISATDGNLGSAEGAIDVNDKWIERRRVERAPTNWQGVLLVDSQPEVLECSILDITAQGARVSIRDALRLPKSVKFRFDRDGQTFDASVAWQLGFDLGLKFELTPDATVAQPERAAA